jgi:signal transduction histidine kinase/CheY-like chemotaxis protein
VYYAGKDNTLRLLGGHAMLSGLPPKFQRGEGLIGEAASTQSITLIKTHRDGGLRIGSALVDAEPRALIFLPLVHDEEVTGVVEIAVLGAWPPQSNDLLLAVRDTISIALEVARARSATRALLAETRRQADELEDARARLEQKADELARASAYKSQFLANMSHELRTPLNAILGFSELMYDGVVAPGSPESKEFLGDILTSGRHLLQLVNDVLDLSKVEAGKLEFNPEPVRLSQVVHEVLSILRTTASTRRVSVESTIDPAVDDLTLDSARLKQILYNYISNALKFTPEGGRVAIRATQHGPLQLKIEVEDTGIGIAEEDVHKLFAEFQQIHSPQKRVGGTGLGLALTKRLVEAQGGSVGVSSVVGKGSTFHAVLPRIFGDTTANARARTMRGVEKRSPTHGDIGVIAAPTVLVVEDDSRDRDELVNVLTSNGYAVEVASTGGDALTLARSRERAFDAITLDLLLPDMTGLEVMQQLRDSHHAGTPVIVITVIAEPGAVAGFAVHDLLPKPFDRDRLIASLGRLGLTSVDPGSVLVVDDDPTSRKMMVSALRQLGYATRAENDGESGLRAVRSEAPSAIVLDLIMPGMNGFEFLAQLRRVPGGRRVPVIVWTSKDLTLDELASLKQSATAVVTKGPRGSSGVVAELAACLPTTREVANGR